jgi:uncharacterized caspase-like protein
VAFTATQDNKPAKEDPRLGHGLFTKAAVEGFRQAEDRDRTVKVFPFGAYLDGEVRRLSGGVQVPKFHLGPENFILARH